MAARTDKDVYMEKLENKSESAEKPPEMWHKEVVGVAMGKYPKRLLAHCS